MVVRKRAGDGGSPVTAISEPHPGDAILKLLIFLGIVTDPVLKD